MHVLSARPADLTYLTSWRDVGAANITCTSGCKCMPEVVDALSAVSTTVFTIRRLQVGAPSCGHSTNASQCM